MCYFYWLTSFDAISIILCRLGFTGWNYFVEIIPCSNTSNSHCITSIFAITPQLPGERVSSVKSIWYNNNNNNWNFYVKGDCWAYPLSFRDLTEQCGEQACSRYLWWGAFSLFRLLFFQVFNMILYLHIVEIPTWWT